MLLSINIERALRWASVAHQRQSRKVSGVPYVEHPFGVSLILDRLEFPEEVVIAGLLHDVVEDTSATFEEVAQLFGDHVADLVRHCSEVKLDNQGEERPWIDRKRDHLEALADSPTDARAVILADKLHNLVSIALDLREGADVWPQFGAGRDQLLWYYRTAVDLVGSGDPRLEAMASECRRVLDEIEKLSPATV